VRPTFGSDVFETVTRHCRDLLPVLAGDGLYETQGRDREVIGLVRRSMRLRKQVLFASTQDVRDHVRIEGTVESNDQDRNWGPLTTKEPATSNNAGSTKIALIQTGASTTQCLLFYLMVDCPNKGMIACEMSLSPNRILLCRNVVFTIVPNSDLDSSVFSVV
jgi:hypothetical protein